MGVFRGGDDERVARIDERAKRRDQLGLRLVLDVVVRIERRQRREIGIDKNLDALWRELCQRLQRRRIG